MKEHYMRLDQMKPFPTGESGHRSNREKYTTPFSESLE